MCLEMTKRGSVQIFVCYVTFVMNINAYFGKKNAKHNNNFSVQIIHGQRVLIKMSVCFAVFKLNILHDRPL